MGDYTVYPDLLTKTPDELRAEAQACRQRSLESFERCDTDGFLSQWASDSTAQLYDFAARLAENGWRHEFEAVFDLDGNLLDAKLYRTKYGEAYRVVVDGEATWFNPSNARKTEVRRANNERKGYRLGRISCRVVPVMRSGGAWSVYPSCIPDRDYPEVEIVSTDIDKE